MISNRKFINSYSDVQVETGVSGAGRVELVKMLFDGLVESLIVAEGHIERKSIADKSFHITRATRIVIGLQGSLDFENGGDIAKNLNDLYGYVARRLLHINIHNDLTVLNEVRGLIEQIRDAWDLVPATDGSVTSPYAQVAKSM